MDYRPYHLIGIKGAPIVQSKDIMNVVIHYGSNINLAKIASYCILNAKIGPVEIFNSKTTWPLAVKEILVNSRTPWVAIWNSDVHGFSKNFRELSAILTPDVGIASPALYGTPYTCQMPGATPRIIDVPCVDGTSLFVNMKVFKCDWLDTRFPWGMEKILCYCVRKAGYKIRVDRGVYYYHIMRASHTPAQVRAAEDGYKEFKKVYKHLLSDFETL